MTLPSLCKPRRARDATATREAILSAAQIAFTEHGYESVGVREIAGRAGVTAALVNRYFGSKEALFAEAVDAAFDFVPFMTGDKASFGDRLARFVVTKRADRTRFDPMLALLRSAASPEAAANLRRAIDRISIPLAVWLGGDDAAERAGLILSQLVGFDLMRNVVGVERLTGGDEELLIARFAEALQACVGC